MPSALNSCTSRQVLVRGSDEAAYCAMSLDKSEHGTEDGDPEQTVRLAAEAAA